MPFARVRGPLCFVLLVAGLGACSAAAPPDVAGAGGDAGAEPGAPREGSAPSGDDGAGSSSDGGPSTADAASPPTAPAATYGQRYTDGQYNLGPVDYDETKFHNACAPSTKYAPAIRADEGNLLAGLWNGIPEVAGYCDACIQVTTAKGKTALLRVVTYGQSAKDSLDVSPEAYALLSAGEYPRTMEWHFTECPATGKVVYEFQTGSSEYWTSLWVRNARVPLTKVEVKSQNHPDYVALARGSDGTLTDGKGFGKGSFTLRLTGADGTQVVDAFAWPAAGIAGVTLGGAGNFP